MSRGDRVGGSLERAGIITADRFRETFDLAWPRIVTGFAIMSKQTADLAMVGIAVVVAVLAEPIASLFVSGSDEIAQTTVFVVVCAVSAVGQGVDGTASGALVGAGDTRLPFVASLLGRYVFALPAAALGLVTPLGVAGLYLALILEMYVPGTINVGLFRSGRWKAVTGGTGRRRSPGDPVT